MQEIANVHGHYERLKKSSVPPSSGVTLLNLTYLVQKCAFEYQQWQDKIAVSWWTVVLCIDYFFKLFSVCMTLSY